MIKLLIVDNEKSIRIGFKKFIDWEKHGIEFINAFSNGCDALEYMLKNPIDILITDIKMPKMDGLTLLNELNNRNIKPKITIVLTESGEYQLVRNCFKLNVDDYLLKSNYNHHNIANLIHTILNDKFKLKEKYLNNRGYSFEVTRILDFLNNNYHKNVSLNSISESINYSESYLSHLFSKEVGMPLFEYLNKLRIEKAKFFLYNTNLKIYEISCKVGFKTVEHFSRLFKKYTGVSPKHYKINSYKNPIIYDSNKISIK